MILLLLLLFEICCQLTIGSFNASFDVTWNFYRESDSLFAKCVCESSTKLPLWDKSRYGLNVICPRCNETFVSKAQYFTDYGPIVIIDVPDSTDADKGNYTCIVYDSEEDREILTKTQELLELPAVTLVTTATTKQPEPNDKYSWYLSWTFRMSSKGFEAECRATSKRNITMFEHIRFKLDVDSPTIMSDPLLQIRSDSTYNSLIRTIIIPDPDKDALGDYNCRLYDKSVDGYVKEIIEKLKELPRQVTTTTHPLVTTTTESSTNPPSSVWLIVLYISVGLVVLATAACVIIKKRQNVFEFADIHTTEFVVREANSAYTHDRIHNLCYNSKFEVDERNLERLECIGGGHFGTVFNGNFKVSQQWPSQNICERYWNPLSVLTVAIKVPGDVDGFCDFAACEQVLKDELKILCSVGSHPNIVTLIGAVTISNNICIVVERCSNGSLLNFLKSKRDIFVPQFRVSMTSEDIVGRNFRTTGQNLEPLPIYDVLPRKFNWKNTSKILTTAHLLSFSMQIALGMNHLASVKCLHRDLAARNILITENMICKIADFGLAKRVNRQDYYRVTYNYDLPVRWMSREAVAELKFTIESDIWSYGIVLYEIFTLGGCPYPSFSNPEVMQAIQDGVVNQQPEFCPASIYNHMLSCWNVNPEKRPTFDVSAELFHNQLIAASPKVLYNIEKELSREQHRHAKLESLRSQE